MKHNSILVKREDDEYSLPYRTKTYRIETTSAPITSTIELLSNEELICEYINELYEMHEVWLSGERQWKRPRGVPHSHWMEDSDFFLNGVKSLLKGLDIDTSF